ncbi:MAG: adenylate/guanylate cyclase domain-containing protein, partial [Nitrososphaerota archaeon]|nr:adenylate/guanylate cyclase domain-containing protein [Nitrososphaerota archaeon]
MNTIEKERSSRFDPNETKRLAILPFVNLSGDPQDEYFADGMTDELITVVSRLPELKVIARTSVMRYKGA